MINFLSSQKRILKRLKKILLPKIVGCLLIAAVIMLSVNSVSILKGGSFLKDNSYGLAGASLAIKQPVLIGKSLRIGHLGPIDSIFPDGKQIIDQSKSALATQFPKPQSVLSQTSTSVSTLESLAETSGSTPSQTFYWPYYDSYGFYGNAVDSIEVGNIQSVSATVTVEVINSGNVVNSWTGTIVANSSQVVNFTNSSGSEVYLTASVPVVATLVAKTSTNLNELPGIQNLSTALYWPYFDSKESLNSDSSYLIVSNPIQNNKSADISISYGPNFSQNSIPAGSNVQLNLNDFTGGPITLVSDTPIDAVELSVNAGTLGQLSVDQQPGFTQSYTNLYWPYLDSVDANSNGEYIRVANINPTQQSGSFTLTIGQTTFTSSTLNYGQTETAYIPGIKNGPVIFNGTIGLIASLHESVGDSVTDLNGLPLLSNLYWATTNSQYTPNNSGEVIFIGNTSTTPATVVLQIGSSGTQNITIGANSTNSIPVNSTTAGPIELTSDIPIVATTRSDIGPPPPTITAVTPPSGNITGGTTVSIVGTNFIGNASVILGSSEATGVSVVSSTLITAKVPKNSPGWTSLTVETVAGSATLTSAFNYIYPSDIFTSGSWGYDVSWPQCPTSSDTNPLFFPPQNFTIIGSDNGAPFTDNSCLNYEVSFAGSNFGLYAVIFWQPSDTPVAGPENCATSSNVTDCQAYNYGYMAAEHAFSYALSQGVASSSWWLDIEGAASSSNPLWTTNYSGNDQAIQGALDFFSSQTVPGIPGQLEKVGIYASPCTWPQIAGGYDESSGCNNYVGYSPDVPAWIADWNSPSSPQIYCNSNLDFTSGGTAMVQYSDNANNLNIDGDYAC